MLIENNNKKGIKLMTSTLEAFAWLLFGIVLGVLFACGLASDPMEGPKLKWRFKVLHLALKFIKEENITKGHP